MAKTNIKFNNKNYEIDEASLSTATSALKSHLSTTMAGTGATINFGGTAYNIDSTKLSTATNNFITHLNTIAGNGAEVVVNGTKYSVDSTKLSGALSELGTAFDKLENPTPDEPAEERLEGDGAEYYTLAPTALSFRSTAPLNELQEIQIDGVTVDPSNYTLEEGSTIVTFPIEYLKTLNVGNYEVDVVSDSKSVKGGFTVAAPELNEYGFYYNQPYTAYVDYFQDNTVFFIREDGTIDVTVSGAIETCPYTISGNSMTVTTSGMGDVHFEISADGIECIELATNFVINDEYAVADNDYIYIYKEDLGGYEVSAIDKTKAEYGKIKNRIRDKVVTQIGASAFQNNVNLITLPAQESIEPRLYQHIRVIDEYAFSGCDGLRTIHIPSSIEIIGGNAFSNCSNLENVELYSNISSLSYGIFSGCSKLSNIVIPDSVESIESDAFYGCSSLKELYMHASVKYIQIDAFAECTSLTDIIFNGNIEDWNSIYKMAGWNRNVPATHVQCFDGQVAL